MTDTKWSKLDSVIGTRFLHTLAKTSQETVRTFSPDLRDAWSQIVVDTINSVVSPFSISADAAQHGQELKEKGISVLGTILTEAEARESREHFLGRPVYNSHAYAPGGGPKADETPRMVGGGAEQFKFGSYAFSDIIGMPHFLKIATHPRIVGAARVQLGAQPTIYSINAWWSFPGHDIGKGLGQLFHRDKDYTRFCVAFTYLTDVDAESGPHHYLEYSHDIPSTQNVLNEAKVDNIPAKDLFGVPGDNYGYDDAYMQIWKDHLREVIGPAGTAFLANTYGLHRGLYPINRPRLVLWVRYSLFAGPPLSQTRVKPDVFHGGYPTDEHMRYMLRGLVEE